MANDELSVLRALRLKGRASTEQLTEATGLPAETVTATIAALVQAEAVKDIRGSWAMVPAARERLDQLLAAERAGVDHAVMAACYERFTEVNDDFKALANDWQTRGEEPNDHTDAAYDQGVLDRLPSIHERVVPIVEEVAGQAPRLAVYRDRLAAALQRVQSGDHAWLLKPLIDSYHTVWFELHEELISLAGLTRLEEAAAGRAQ